MHQIASAPQTSLEEAFLSLVIAAGQLPKAEGIEYPKVIVEFFEADNCARYFGGRNVVLLLDDIDAIREANPEERKRLLSALSAVKRMRAQGRTCLLSALAVTNVVAEYLFETVGNSPFTTGQPIYSPYFSIAEHEDLFGQYETQEGISIDQKTKNRIHSETTGAPGLEQMLGKHYDGMRIQLGRQPTHSEWLGEVLSNRLFNDLDRYANFTRITTPPECSQPQLDPHKQAQSCGG